jgi:hypothetical protein
MVACGCARPVYRSAPTAIGWTGRTTSRAQHHRPRTTTGLGIGRAHAKRDRAPEAGQARPQAACGSRLRARTELRPGPDDCEARRGGDLACSLTISDPGCLVGIPPPQRGKGRLAIFGERVGPPKAIPACRTKRIDGELRHHVLVPQQRAVECPGRGDNRCEMGFRVRDGY